MHGQGWSVAGDLILAFCRAPHLADNTTAPEDIARPVLAARIDALPLNVIEQVAWILFGDLADVDACARCLQPIERIADSSIELRHAGGDTDHDAVLDSDGHVDTPGELGVRRALHRCCDALFADNRVCYSVVLDGRAWVVSGGVSGGDSPTDEYDALLALAIAEVTTEPIGSC